MAMPTRRTGLLPFARVQAKVLTILAAAFLLLVTTLRLIIFAMVAAVELALRLISILMLRQ